ncbi:cytidylyltransferase domain-containing protein [Photobacterium damselae]|uniref:acylneuraminate cytidylyltransferase family protein n=1 Tax=Photobacterium damselae TaxID=38293 RepID=UPI000D06133E|nr:acylneuraminate cytidylyltransferase family protein [Photobacterium damselae]PSB80704.1 CMP-N-acetlyneuraminic acid synthetase [Photobacterium damselae subsp. damselae]
MNILAIIPARAGSKRLPNKNILDLGGKPLIQWTIEAAIKCSQIETVMVSTDSKNIADVSEKVGVSVPYLRSPELSSDTASSTDVVIDVIEYYKSIGKYFDTIMLLQPTSPLRSVDDIKNAVKLFNEKNANAVVSVTECEHSPLWCNTINDDLNLDDFINDELKNTRSQDLPKYYRLNGAIYLVDVNSFIKEKTFMPINTYALKMDNERSVDIDTELDFRLAELIIKA